MNRWVERQFEAAAARSEWSHDPGADEIFERKLDLWWQGGRRDRFVGADLRIYARRRLAEVTADVERIDTTIEHLLLARRARRRAAERYHAALHVRNDKDHRRLPRLPEALRPPSYDAAEELAGAELRSACEGAVLRAGGPLGVAEVREALVAWGFDARPVGRGRSPIRKAIADALGEASRRGRLRRVGRGRYAPP